MTNKNIIHKARNHDLWPYKKDICFGCNVSVPKMNGFVFIGRDFCIVCREDIRKIT